MIGKKIANPKKSASKRERITALATYIRSPETESSTEKAVYVGARGFAFDDPDLYVAEMISLADECPRSRDPIKHYILSWHPNEMPSNGQIDEAVTLLLDEFKMLDHQVLYALHADTDNLHVHVMINAVNPKTSKVKKINRGFDLEALHRAVARIEHAQGWQPEKKGRYTVAAGAVVRSESPIENPTGPEDEEEREKTRIRQTTIKEEIRTGEKSVERIASEIVPGIVKRASSWMDFHQKLAEHGLVYVKHGSGASIGRGGIFVKASSADHKASRPKLEKRFGPFEAAPAITEEVAITHVPAHDIKPVPLHPDAGPQWVDYIVERKKKLAAKRDDQTTLRAQHHAERQELRARQRRRRERIFDGDWRGYGLELMALRSILAAEQAKERAALKETQEKDWKVLRQKYGAVQSYEMWRQSQSQEDTASAGTSNNVVLADRSDALDIRDFAETVENEGIKYRRRSTGDLAFVDRGQRIELIGKAGLEEGAILAALQLAAQKFGPSLYVFGSDEQKTLIARVAAKNWIRIANPELQEEIAAERERVQRERFEHIPEHVRNDVADRFADVLNRLPMGSTQPEDAPTPDCEDDENHRLSQ